MISAWRLLRRELAKHAFDGEGARLYGGRWNSPGTAMTYCSATASLAALEVFANVPRFELAGEYVLFECTFDESVVEIIESRALPKDWQRSPAPAELQRIGDEWARDRRSVVLAVPSAIIEHERNYLLNPKHPDFKRVWRGRPQAFAFDARLR